MNELTLLGILAGAVLGGNIVLILELLELTEISQTLKDIEKNTRK